MLKRGSFIHGGAWRDPLVDATSFKPTVDILSASESGVVGFASINYRLSRYPNHGTKPSSPEDPSRNAEHPDHLNDVTRALIFLEKIYGISGRYLLAGHSCGATLAFQVRRHMVVKGYLSQRVSSDLKESTICRLFLWFTITSHSIGTLLWQHLEMLRVHGNKRHHIRPKLLRSGRRRRC